MNFCTLWRLKFTKLTNFKAPKMIKTPVLVLLNSPKLISRKIWMTKKSWNFSAHRRIIRKGQWHRFKFNYLLLNLTEFRWKYLLYLQVGLATQLVLKKGFSFYLLVSQKCYEIWPSNIMCAVQTVFSLWEKKFRENWNSSEI